MNKDQTYHQIALACLKTLREPQNAAADNQVENLYKAIDEAFESQMALLLAELEEQRQRLNLIQSLDPKQHSLEDAQAIAADVKPSH